MKIFLTGATGFLGGELLMLLSKLPGVDKIFCLVRAGNSEEAEARLQKAFDFHNDYWDRSKVFPIIGNLSDDSLSGKLSSMKELRDISVVIHSAANTSFLPQRENMVQKTNIGGAIQVSDWASTLEHLETFVYVGTAMIRGCDPEAHRRVIKEDESPKLQVSHIVRYTYSKLIGEISVRERIPQDKLLVVRPSIIMADSRVWASRSNDILWAMASINALRLCPVDSLAICDLIPVDWAADAIAKLIFCKTRKFTTYHISAGGSSTNLEKLTGVCAELDPYRPEFEFAGEGVLAEIKKWTRKKTSSDDVLQLEYGKYLRYWDDYFEDRNSLRILLTGMDKYFKFINLGQTFDNSRLLDEVDIRKPEPAHIYLRRIWEFVDQINLVDGALNP